MNNRGHNARNTASRYSRNWPISLPASLGVVFLAATWSTCASSFWSTVIDCLTNPRCCLGNSNPHRRTNPRGYLADYPKPHHLCNRLLRCYVLIDLKLGKLAHQDLGQMQMYVNYFDRYVKQDDEAPTVGILLCKMKSDALVEITLPRDSNITAARYQTYLPDKETLKQELLHWAEGQGDGDE